MSSGSKQRNLIVAVAVGVGLAGSTAALAAAGNSLTITGPSTAHVGVKFSYTVKGRTSKVGRGLSMFLNTGLRCPQTYQAERGTAYANTEYGGVLTKHRFRIHLDVTPRATGPHYICAYIYKRPSGATVLRASHKYVTRS